jgi:hypothetical protein
LIYFAVFLTPSVPRIWTIAKEGGGALTWDEYEAQQKEEKKKTKVTAANPYWQKLIKF